MECTKVEFVYFKGSLCPVNYLFGNGSCFCNYHNWHDWTSACVKFFGKIYCIDCFKKILANQSFEKRD